MSIFNFIVALALFANVALSQTCQGQAASGAPPSNAQKVALADTVGGVTSFSASGCTLQITRAEASPAGKCNAQINGVSSCDSAFTIFIGNDTFRSFAGGADTGAACFTDTFDCSQGISVAQNSASGGGVGGNGGNPVGRGTPVNRGNKRQVTTAPSGPQTTTAPQCDPDDDCCSNDDGCS